MSYTPPPIEPIYGIVEQVQSMADSVADAARKRDEISRQIGRIATQQTVLDPRK